MQNAPALSASWFAIVKAAWNTGSRADWAIRLTTQVSYGGVSRP